MSFASRSWHDSICTLNNTTDCSSGRSAKAFLPLPRPEYTGRGSLAAVLIALPIGLRPCLGVEPFPVLNVVAVVLVVVVSTVVVVSAGVEERKKEEGDGRQEVKVSGRAAGGQGRHFDQITTSNVLHRIYIKHCPHCFPQSAQTPSTHRTAAFGLDPRVSVRPVSHRARRVSSD